MNAIVSDIMDGGGCEGCNKLIQYGEPSIDIVSTSGTAVFSICMDCFDFLIKDILSHEAHRLPTTES